MNEIRLMGPIDYPQIAEILNQLEDVRGETRLFICSGGGSIAPALAFYHYVRGKKIDLTTIAIGDTSSAAIIVWLSGITRLVAPDVTMLVHPAPYFNPPGEQRDENETRVQKLRVEQWNKAAAKIVSQSSDLKLTEVVEIIGKRALLEPEELIRRKLAHGLFRE